MNTRRIGRILLIVVGAVSLSVSSPTQAKKRIPSKERWKVKQEVLQIVPRPGSMDFRKENLQSFTRENGNVSFPQLTAVKPEGLEKGRSSADNMYGGWSRYDVYGDFNDIFGFDITDPKSPYELATDDRLLSGNHYICAAAWDGKQVHFVSEVYIPSYETFTIGYRGTLDPLTGEMKLLGSSGYASQQTGNLSSMTYDFTDGKLYGVSLKGELFLVSQTDSTSTLIDTIRVNGKPGHMPLTLSASAGGTLYSVFSDGYLYKINKRNATAMQVGSVGGQVYAAYQSATFDRLSGTLYWARPYEDKIDLCVIDTLTGHATFYSEFGLQTCGLFHMYYEDACDVPLSPVENLSYQVEGKQMTLSWKNPSTNQLGVEVDCLEKVYVYKASGLDDYELFDSVLAVQAGSVSEYTYEEDQDGYYRYAVVAVNTKGLFSYAVETEYGFYDYQLPYQTGFETSDYNAPLVKDPGVDYVDDPSLVYDGTYSAYIPPYSNLRITGLPLGKGTTYRLSFVARGSEVGMEGEYKPFTRIPFATLNVRIDGKTYYPEVTRSMEWVEASVEIYTTETKAYTLAFATSVFDEYYLDNVKIEVLRPNTVPGRVQEASVSNQGTSLLADLTWKNPVLTAGGDHLEQLSDVIVWVSPYNRFDEEDVVLCDTVLTTEPGAEVNVSFPVPYDRFWYFRLLARNESGPSPMDTVIGSRWIGKDTVMEAPIGLQAESQSDGTVRLSWYALSGRGENGGDLDGEVTGYRIFMRAGDEESFSVHESHDTVWNTDELSMDYYTFGVCGVRNGKYDGDTSYVRILAGFYGGQTAVEPMESDAGFTTAPFNVSTDFSDNSTVNQVIFPKRLFKEPCIIDTLYFLVDPVRISFSQKIKIHMGYQPKDLFVEYDDWVAIKDLLEVYSGNLRFEKGENVLKIPIKPFYYNGKENLLLSVIKAKQVTKMNLNVISNPCSDSYRQMHDYHPATLDDYYELTGKPVMGSGVTAVPILIVNKMQELNLVRGRVTDVEGKPLSGAVLTFCSKVSDTVVSRMEFTETLKTDEEGNYSFSCFPDNLYSVKVTFPGMRDIDTMVVLRYGDTLDWNISMLSAAKVVIQGKVRDASGNAVEGVEVGIVQVDSVRSMTASDGSFILPEVYGSTGYTLYASHDLYLDYTEDIVLGEDAVQTLPEITLLHYPFPVRNLVAEAGKEKVSLSWEKPVGNMSVTERKYCGDSKSAICSSAEIAIGIRFPKKDLKEWMDEQAGLNLGSISFHAKDTTAFYSMHIYSGDFSVPVISQEIGYKPEGMYRVFLDEALPIDTTADLLVSVKARAGYEGCPFANDQLPEIKDGSMVNMGDGWKNMSDYMVSPSDASNWILSAHFGQLAEIVDPLSYDVFRAKEHSGLYEWEALANVQDTVLEYEDADWKDQPAGEYRYAVKARWGESGSSHEKISSLLDKDMYFKVEIKIALHDFTGYKGVDVRLSGLSDDRIYSMQTQEAVLSFDSVRRGGYLLEVTSPGFSNFTGQVEIVSDTVLSVPLTEVSVVPSSESQVEVFPNPSSNGRFQVNLNTEGKVRAEVFGLTGIRMMEIFPEGKLFEVDLSPWPSGVYVLKLHGTGGVRTLRLIRR